LVRLAPREQDPRTQLVGGRETPSASNETNGTMLTPRVEKFNRKSRRAGFPSISRNLFLAIDPGNVMTSDDTQYHNLPILYNKHDNIILEIALDPKTFEIVLRRTDGIPGGLAGIGQVAAMIAGLGP
jgi:hypothetical protein